MFSARPKYSSSPSAQLKYSSSEVEKHILASLRINSVEKDILASLEQYGVMKINVNQIPPEGLALEENIPASGLDLELDTVKIRGPVRINARVSRITNAVDVDLDINASAYTVCSRCLNEIEIDLRKNLRLNYAVDRSVKAIDFGSQIREEIILEYPLKPLCEPDCLGLCFKCGKNLNEGKCDCI